MSYRAFKRLLGETSLERKCHLLFGTVSLLLIAGSFFWYARRTEELIYDQSMTTGRLLVPSALTWLHFQRFQKKEAEKPAGATVEAEHWKQQYERWKTLYNAAAPPVTARDLPDQFRSQDFRVITHSHAGDLMLVPTEDVEYRLLEEFREGRSRESIQRRPASKVIDYYRAIHAAKECRSCHEHGERADNEFMAIVRITIPTAELGTAIEVNRAVLISVALVTVLLLMAGSYLIVRYVIVKPVKHLKEVSDAISAGELNVRSEIQTGDEFEDLSHAFNRMLRNLVSMQDRLRKANTDLDRKVDELAQANLALFESNRLKSDFLATMSHELRTPLNSILGFSDLLSSNEQLGEKPRRWAANIRTSGDRLLNLINDILDLAKVEAGKMQVHPEEFHLQDVCEGLLTLFRPMSEKKNIDLRQHYAPGIPLLRQDVGKLQQILSNVLSNAIKFTPEGGRILLQAEADTTRLHLSVTDTGVGIAPEDQEHVFDKFRQAGNPLTREYGGTGLGLSIVRELSKLLGGEVTLQSELGRGSTFKVTLPLEFDRSGAPTAGGMGERRSA